MTWVVGLDCGASNARAVVLDRNGRLLARSAHACGAAATSNDLAPTTQAIESAVREAVDRAGAELPAASLWAGVAGAGRAGVASQLEEALRSTGLAQRVTVGTDADTALHAAFGTGEGVVVIAGTGSVALARRTSPEAPGGYRRFRVGGWGPAIDDAGSGCWIGMRALKAVARATDGRDPETSLTDGVAGHLGDANIVTWAEKATRRDFADLAPLVFGEYEQGDHAAQAIVEDARAALTELARRAVRRSGPWMEPAPLALVGGLVGEGGPLRNLVVDGLAARGRSHPRRRDAARDEIRSREEVRIRLVEGGDAALAAARLALAAVDRNR